MTGRHSAGGDPRHTGTVHRSVTFAAQLRIRPHPVHGLTRQALANHNAAYVPFLSTDGARMSMRVRKWSLANSVMLWMTLQDILGAPKYYLRYSYFYKKPCAT